MYHVCFHVGNYVINYYVIDYVMLWYALFKYLHLSILVVLVLETQFTYRPDWLAPYIHMCQTSGVSSIIEQVRYILWIHSTVRTT